MFTRNKLIAIFEVALLVSLVMQSSVGAKEETVRVPVGATVELMPGIQFSYGKVPEVILTGRRMPLDCGMRIKVGSDILDVKGRIEYKAVRLSTKCSMPDHIPVSCSFTISCIPDSAPVVNNKPISGVVTIGQGGTEDGKLKACGYARVDCEDPSRGRPYYILAENPLLSVALPRPINTTLTEFSPSDTYIVFSPQGAQRFSSESVDSRRPQQATVGAYRVALQLKGKQLYVWLDPTTKNTSQNEPNLLSWSWSASY